MRTIVKLACIAWLAAVTINPSDAHAQTKWDYSSEYGPTALSGRSSAFFAKRVKELTDGKLEITVHYGGGLGFKSQDHYTAVEDGAVPVADTPFNRMNGIYPIFDMQSLPFLQSTLKDAKILDELLRPVYNNVMQKNDQFILYTVPWTPQGFWATKSVTSEKDLADLRIRVNDLAAVQTLKNAGSDAIQMSWGDTLTALSTGSINGVLTSDDTGFTGKLPETGLKHFSAVGFTVGLQVTHVNRTAFNALPEDVQTAVLVAAAETERHGWDLAAQTVENNVGKMKEAGVTVTTDIPDEFRDVLKKAAAPAIDAWKKRFGPQADNLLQAYEARLEEK